MNATGITSQSDLEKGKTERGRNRTAPRAPKNEERYFRPMSGVPPFLRRTIAFSNTVILVSQVYFGSPFRLPFPTLMPCCIMKSSSAIIGVVSSLLPYHLHHHHTRRPALLERFRGQIDPTS